tara:strand:+ start:874 stop:2118 length:1245 start_codon:yes stop_codon:yes gene_type:complete
LLLSEEEMPDVYYSILENASDTEPTLDPLREMIANQKAQDDFLMMMAGGPKQPAKSAINVGMQRFMLPANEIARTATTRSGAPKTAIQRQETINTAYQTALNQIRKAEDLIRDTIGMKNPAGQLKQADAMKAAALKEIERIRKAGGGKLPDLMPDKLTTEQIQQAMQEAGLGSLIKKLGNGGPTGDRVEVLGVEALEFPEDLIEYLPPDIDEAMKVGNKYYSRPEDYDALVAEAELQQYAQSQGRNDPDVKFGNNPEFDKKANISGTGIEEAGRNIEYNPDGSFAQEPNIYRYEYDETAKLLENENYLIGEEPKALGYYDENTDTLVMPGEYAVDAYPEGRNKPIEAHELMHRALPDNPSVISAGNEHLYIADKTNEPELFERYRLEHYPNMPKPLFDIYYENVIKRHYDNKFE